MIPGFWHGPQCSHRCIPHISLSLEKKNRRPFLSGGLPRDRTPFKLNRNNVITSVTFKLSTVSIIEADLMGWCVCMYWRQVYYLGVMILTMEPLQPKTPAYVDNIRYIYVFKKKTSITHMVNMIWLFSGPDYLLIEMPGWTVRTSSPWYSWWAVVRWFLLSCIFCWITQPYIAKIVHVSMNCMLGSDMIFSSTARCIWISNICSH